MELIVCCGCKGGTALADALGQGLPDVTLRRVECLSVCSDPATMAVQAADSATYVFSGLMASDVDDISAMVAAYRAAPLGWIADARPLGRLRMQLVTRVPAIP